MTFENFKNLLEAVRKDYEWIDHASDVLNSDCFYENLCCGSAVLDFMAKEFKDEENDWIGYFIFELDWGTKYTPDKVTDKNGNMIPLATYEDLYALLANNLKECKKNEAN